MLHTKSWKCQYIDFKGKLLFHFKSPYNNYGILVRVPLSLFLNSSLQWYMN